MNEKVIQSESEKLYVPVKDEPMHVQILENPFVRVYTASLAPGEKTMFHRHSEDTIYIVLSGGDVSTELLDASQSCPAELPRSLRLHSKLWMGLRKFFNGKLRLYAGFFFFMPSKKFPTIHRAAASKNNQKDVDLIGVEILKKSNGNAEVNFDKKYFKKDFDSDNFGIYQFKIQPGQISDFSSYNCSGLITAISGTVLFNLKAQELKAGKAHWCRLSEIGNITNKENTIFKALVIVVR
jgi:quercetin dioxygenase-like cupin family protein